MPPKQEQAATGTVDLGARERLLIEQLQQDEGYAAQLTKELAAVEERIHRWRGKLELIAELNDEVRASTASAPPTPPTPPTPAPPETEQAAA